MYNIYVWTLPALFWFLHLLKHFHLATGKFVTFVLFMTFQGEKTDGSSLHTWSLGIYFIAFTYIEVVCIYLQLK